VVSPNVRCLCLECHADRTAEQSGHRKRRRVARDGWSEAQGKSAAIVSLELFIRRCREAQRFFSQNQITDFNENYVRDPAWVEWDNTHGAHAVVVDFGRGLPPMRIPAPNLSRLPRYEDLVAPLLDGKSIAAE